MAACIEDYALIGNCRSAALISRQGSLDWLCLPDFDSGACFAALLGTPLHGRFLLTAAQPAQLRRRYVPDTLVLETQYLTGSGHCRVRDAMLLHGRHPVLVRLVEGLAGTVAMELELVIRFDYGAIVPWIRWEGDELISVGGPDTLRLRTPVRLREDEHILRSTFMIRAGETLPLVLTWHSSHTSPPPGLEDPIAALSATEDWWRDWAGRCEFRGSSIMREAVVRSLLTLKALTYEPTGGIIAAPTTSLPERLGGVRNWDYRYCWLRDSTMTLYALLSAGYRREAQHWREWLVRAVAGTPAQAHILYGLDGERRLPEVELPWLPGYEGSRPVRTGNAAHSQLQLDIFGEVMDTLHLARRKGLPADDEAWRVQREMMEHLRRIWREPDEGMWEIRGPRRHFTHSKVMAWLAFDRALLALREDRLRGPEAAWLAARENIHQEVCARAYDPELGHFVESYGSRRLDANLLQLGLVGFLSPQDTRFLGTVRAIERELLWDGLLRRYRTEQPGADGLPPGEGVFLACSCWLADTYALLGRRAEAERLFERLLALRNDVGLLSEEYDVEAGRMLGNFPQAFSHIALIDTAYNLAQPDGPVKDRSHRRSGRPA